MSWKEEAQKLQKEAHVFYCAFKHPRVPWYARVVAACSAGYLFSPVQLIPSFIPVIGFLDDFLVLFLGARLFKSLIPPEVLAECRQLAESSEIRRKEEIRTKASVVAFVAIAALWLVTAITASALMMRYLRR
jgi:uncharacterized membrane protein YkvA (DUF1232 family)